MTVFLIVYLLPKGGKFKYDYFKGKPWQYENYYAPFNFAIQKSQDDIDKEIANIEQKSKVYFAKDNSIEVSVIKEFEYQLSINYLRFFS